ncbi:MAG: DNA-methyltransferase [Mycoplasma sp.]
MRKIYNIDYLELLKTLEPKSIDFICIDPPYGKINGMQLSGQKQKVDWDISINWEEMFFEFNRVIKDGGTICVFGQQPTYSQMILSNLKDFKYELIWEKNNAAQGFHANKMPLCFTENIAVFIRNEKTNFKRTFNNIAEAEEIDKEVHFTRWYAQQIFNFIKIPRRKVHEKLGHRSLEFFGCFTGKHFGMISKPLYEELILEFGIDKCDFFISFEELKEKQNQEKDFTKGVKLDSSKYSKTLSNVLKVSKENKYLHPTQKPVELMKKLISMYSKENDVVLDCFMGSGSTGVACKELKRRFIGCELNKEYFEICKERIL